MGKKNVHINITDGIVCIGQQEKESFIRTQIHQMYTYIDHLSFLLKRNDLNTSVFKFPFWWPGNYLLELMAGISKVKDEINICVRTVKTVVMHSQVWYR